MWKKKKNEYICTTYRKMIYTNRWLYFDDNDVIENWHQDVSTCKDIDNDKK